MKTKLRKEFEDYVKKTEKRLWTLENPPKFKYGDTVWYLYSDVGENPDFWKCTYKEEEIKENIFGYFYMSCTIDTGKTLLCIMEHELYGEEMKQSYIENH